MPSPVLRWYFVRFPGDPWKTEVFAERFFDSREEADEYAGPAPLKSPPAAYPIPCQSVRIRVFGVCVEIA
jgi:hypothetical protein